jgi:5-methylcytosine-specific restriction endonuclease McrA
VLRAWRGEQGNWCPGYQRAAHPGADLTVDHVVPLAAGGAPFEIANCAVLCRFCNSTKGASTDRGSPQAGSALLEDRAARLCSLGRVSRVVLVARWAISR